MEETPRYPMFYKKDSKGDSYSNEALLYRDILRYLYNNQPNYYKSRAIAEWLLDNNKEYLEFYSGSIDKTKKANKVNNIIKRIKDKLEKMVENEIIQAIPTEMDTVPGGTTLAHSITEFGQLIHLIIELDQKVNCEDVFDKIYTLIMNSVLNSPTTSPSSKRSFLVKLIENSKKENVISIIVDNIKDRIFHDSGIPDRHAFFKYMLFLPFDNDEKTKQLWKVWKKSFNQLEENDMRYFTYYMKIQLYHIIEPIIIFYGEYEKARFDGMPQFYNVELEGICERCNVIYVFSIGIMTLLEAIYEDRSIIDSVLKNSSPCPKCNTPIKAILPIPT